MNRKLAFIAASAAAAFGLSDAAHAQVDIDQVVVTGTRPEPLDKVTDAGSRLGLSVRETPATIYTLDASAILGRGIHTVEDAARALPGVLAAFPPGDMGNFSVRGFTGNQISLLYNGFYYGPAMMIARPGASFNVDRVEVIKGPAAILYGNGAIGGAINVVTKQPQFGRNETLAMASYGSFETYDLGVDLSRQVNDTLAVRAVAGGTGSAGYVHDDSSHTFEVNLGALWRPNDRFQALFSIDYANDRPSKYFGSPLLPAGVVRDALPVIAPSASLAIDRTTRYVNYNNLNDSRIKSTQWTPQVALTWTPAEGVEINNETFYIRAKRAWRNSEVYAYNTTTKLIDRDRFFVIHDQKLWGDRATARFKNQIGGRPNTFLLGGEYSHLDFVHTRGFPDGDSVNRLTPASAPFGPMIGRVSPTQWDAYAVFAEDTLDLTGKAKLVLGARWDGLDLDRKNYGFNGRLNTATSFTRRISAASYRAGLLYNVTETITPYLSYSTGRDLAGSSSSLFLINADQGKSFDLARASQAEAGVKASSPDRRLNMTAAAYRIKRSDFLTQINTAGDLANIGSQASKGFELTGDARVNAHWTVSADASYTHSRFGAFVDPDFGINASGKTPPNVASWVAGAWTSYREIANLPVEIGGGVRYVGARYAATDNVLKMRPYTTVDAYLAYDLTPKIRLTGRVKNLFNKAYVQWADVFYPTELVLAPPRSFEVSVIARF
jgi:iron complex outermembrane receptor protein